QAEAGIRDFHVTGVQTCALPIFDRAHEPDQSPPAANILGVAAREPALALAGEQLGARPNVEAQLDLLGRDLEPLEQRPVVAKARSEARRVGKQCGSRASPAAVKT